MGKFKNVEEFAAASEKFLRVILRPLSLRV